PKWIQPRLGECNELGRQRFTASSLLYAMATPVGLAAKQARHLFAPPPSKCSMIRLALAIAFAVPAGAQIVRGLAIPPSGNNQPASVTQHIGPVKETIDYSSPAVHGPDGKDRRGQIWGKLVPYGMTDLGFRGGKPSPWRGGANENTVFTVSDPVTIEGQALAAGQYGLHLIAGADEWTVIF